MAQEIKIVTSIQVDNGSFKFPRIGSEQLAFKQVTRGGGVPGMITVGEVEEDLDLSELSEYGWIRFKNCDSDALVKIGPKVAGNLEPFILLYPGETAQFPLDPETTVRIVATAGEETSGTAEAQVQVHAFNR